MKRPFFVFLIAVGLVALLVWKFSATPSSPESQPAPLVSSAVPEAAKLELSPVPINAPVAPERPYSPPVVHDARPKAGPEWDRFLKAVRVHEEGHRAIYDREYRNLVIGAMQELWKLKIVGEVHLPSTPDIDADDAPALTAEVQRQMKVMYEDKVGKFSKRTAAWKSAEKTANKAYEDKTNHGTTQNAHPDFPKAENTILKNLKLESNLEQLKSRHRWMGTPIAQLRQR